VKFNAVMPLPWWGLTTAVNLQSYPGPEILANYTVTNAQVQPTLGRPLSGGQTTTSVPLIAPYSLFGDRWNQLDLRVAKIFKVGRGRINASADVYNLFNAAPGLSVNNTYGPAWQAPLAILSGRFLKLGVGYTF
jgi:hypothetical protein